MRHSLGSSKCVHELIAQKAGEAPDAIAVIGKDSQLSYRELDNKANQLAYWLQLHGAGPDVLIGLFMERCPDMVVALLAILKSGSAYVPLDSAYPKERLAYILEETEPPILITHSQLRKTLPDCPARLFSIDTDWDATTQFNKNDTPCQVDDHCLAYVIYTSGSTGKPKGVMIEHHSLLNYVKEAIDRFRINSADRVLQFASLSFDTAAEEIYPILIQGGTLILRTDEMLASPARFLSTCANWKISILDLPTSYWHQLVASLIKHELDLSLIRLVIIGGESAARQSVINWNLYLRSHQKEIHLWNTYGPTETTIVATVCEISHIVDNPGEETPIGRPIRKLQIYVLDQSLNPVPEGESGELFIGGIGLAREYLNRPNLTAQAFIADKFSDKPKARLYKTGDIVRYNPEGDLEYIGRVDDQVKLDGFRVELGEIESALNTHSKVDQAAVCVRDSETSKSTLIAYVVTTIPDSQINNQLRDHLQKTLPHYMIPQLVMKLGTLPLTINGKVDRKALLELHPEPVRSIGDYIPANTKTEKCLQVIWQKVLEYKENIGIQDDFFTLGGHSLLAIKVLAYSNEEFHTTLSLRSFFDYPTIEKMALFIDETTARNVKSKLSPIQPRTSTDNPPLSFLQEELWVYEQINPGTTVHTVSQGYKLQGELNVSALNKSINKIIRRHSILRTSYEVQAEEPTQIIRESLKLDLTTLDLCEYTQGDQQQLIQDVLQDEVNKPFTFPQGPFIRARLLTLADDEHIVLFLIHHSVFDGWSLGLFLRELETLYAAFVKGQPSPLADMSIQYADFAVWQRQILQGDALDKKLAYWRGKLSDERPINLLPTDYPRKNRQGARGAVELLKISKKQLELFTAVGHQFNASSFIIFLAAFMVLIYRYIGEKDITIKSLVAGRSRPELENIIGYIANTLPFRAQIDPSTSFKQHLESIRELCLEVYANDDIPYYLLAQHFNRHLEHEIAAAEIHFIHYQVEDRHLKLPGLEVNPFDVYANSSHGDLAIFVDESNDGARVIAEYNTDLFKAETINRLLALYEQLIKSISIDPEISIAQLRLLPDEVVEQQRAWNVTRADFPDTCLHTLIEKQTEHFPEAVAVTYEGESCSYQSLQEKSNRLAHYLQALGVGPDVIVGLCIEPSIELLVGVLGILKAGGAYLPIDPTHPQERIRLVIEDANVSISLTQESLSALLPAQNVRVVCLDSDWETISRSSGALVHSSTLPENLAYVIYTSGSTGRPKGVMVQHTAVVNFVGSMANKLEFSDQDVFLAITRLSFDISVLELLLPLTIGARIVIASDESVVDPYKLVELCEAETITVLQATPVTWRLLLTADWQGPSVKALCGGEAMPTELARDLFPRAGRVWNVYGPTETTVWSTYYEIQDAEDDVLIGRPIDNTQCYLLDAYMQPVPIGVMGELYIGGSGVTLGYLNRPELTAQHFVPDPISKDSNARLFKTGDFARYLSYGNIEYLGRQDSQVKIRGFRIELGEIEAVIGAQSSVRQTVVLVTEQQPDDQKLTAYVVFDADKPQVEQLAQELATLLPDYMLPQHIIALERFPTTSSGKVDRKALPSPEITPKTHYLSPRSSTEKYLAIVWEEALGIEADTAGLRDNFFDLGGHSLLAIQVVSRLTHGLKIEFPLRLMFESIDLQDMAKRIDDIRQHNNQGDSSESLVVPLQVSQSGVPLFCICGIDLYRYLAHALPDSQAVYTIFIPGESDMLLNGREYALANFPSVEELASHYVDAIIAYLPKGPMHIAGISFGGILAYEIAQQLRSRGRQVGMLALLDAFHSDCFKTRPFTWILKSLFIGVKKAVLLSLKGFKPSRYLLESEQDEKHIDSPHTWGGAEFKVFRSEAYEVAMGKYSFKDYPNKTVVFKAAETKDGFTYKVRPDYGWSSSVSGELTFHRIPGDHLDILREPSVHLLGRQMALHISNIEKQLDIQKTEVEAE